MIFDRYLTWFYITDLSQAVENLSLEQHISLGSACGTPEYTNFTNGFADCLDYIYYEKSNLAVDQVSTLALS